MSAIIKKGDEVVVITGSARGSRGRVLEVLPRTERVVVEGINIRKRHTRKTEKSAGGIIEREFPIHISNVMEAKRFEERAKRKGAAV